MHLRHLWEPFNLSGMKLRNRVVMPAMFSQYADEGGNVTERMRRYYEARARGGVGLIIVEAACVQQKGQILPCQLRITDDSVIPCLRELVDLIRQHGPKVILQLHHGGRIARSEVGLAQPVGPSPLPVPGGEVPKELTIEEIEEIVTCFSKAAVRATKAGFEGIELHAANSYLIDQFISPLSNKRQDCYGGSLANRARFLIEIIEAIRKAVGSEFPVWPRITGREYGVEGGTTLEDSKIIAQMAQEAGAHAIHVRGAGPGAPDFFAPHTFRPAVIADLAEEIKKAVGVPVIAVGMITPEAGERLIAEGKADLVAIGRGLLADPELPQKAAAGRMKDINPCVICNNCVNDVRSPTVVGMRCTVNAALGREAQSQIIPASQKKKILVIGGGPAGMEAARVAVLRGHQVTLWEKENRLGGQLQQAAVLPYKDRIAVFNTYLQTQLMRLGVHVQTEKKATSETIRDFDPEAVVLATGIKPKVPNIPGISLKHVIYAEEVLGSGIETGDRVVVMGGELVGCETAEFLAEKGKKVTVTRRGQEFATGVLFILRPWFLSRLERLGVALLPGLKYNEITSAGLVVTTKEGKVEVIEADTIVLATGSIPNIALHEELKNKVSEIYLVGDCVYPRTIRDAISDGHRIGLSI
jgi:2,4-dienoyl-CoA reductase-like NADH-dependent reductase (Old Yellow Enzyme family)/thioredoxin reductase